MRKYIIIGIVVMAILLAIYFATRFYAKMMIAINNAKLNQVEPDISGNAGTINPNPSGSNTTTEVTPINPTTDQHLQSLAKDLFRVLIIKAPQLGVLSKTIDTLSMLPPNNQITVAKYYKSICVTLKAGTRLANDLNNLKSGQFLAKIIESLTKGQIY